MQTFTRRAFGLTLGASALTVAACAKRPAYNGPPVTGIVVNKSARRIYLLNYDNVLKAYDVDLGFSPEGHKQFEGDGRTPEGTYQIDRRNPRSQFHLSVGISYPNDNDRALAFAAGKRPGGDIFIHGEPNNERPKKRDWTAGCIAVKNDEIEEIYVMVPLGTSISLRA
ncbi:L,D-transpeptidase family protein [Chachezhania sediminis]|uniref:L,D-transpeptidase family protein n=1 Tax=Chachezhania sediminis TaxID=2599291 RepID=UPI001E45D0A5|nr:L,D-transpeptidase family protein [Chachezhania sediminis]